MNAEKLMNKAIKESAHSLKHNHGGPFGAVVVKNGKIVASAHNTVLKSKDPTAHAEVNAIRKACKKLKTPSLEGCELYTSCEPCPMCLGAIMWARFDTVYYATSREDAAKIEFDDSYFYDQISKEKEDRDIKFEQLSKEKAFDVMKKWSEKNDSKLY